MAEHLRSILPNKKEVLLGITSGVLFSLAAPTNEGALLFGIVTGVATPYVVRGARSVLGNIVNKLSNQHNEFQTSNTPVKNEVGNTIASQQPVTDNNTPLYNTVVMKHVDLAGPKASDFGHATGVLRQLDSAENATDAQYSRVPGNRQKAIKNFQAIVREKVAKGELQPEALERFNIPPEE